MIYSCTASEIKHRNGWSKIGYTETQTIEECIKEQTHTADGEFALDWKRNTQYQDGTGDYFKGDDFYNFITRKKSVERDGEWFHIASSLALEYFDEFISRDYARYICDPDEKSDYALRQEQDAAVMDTVSYFGHGGKEFFWNTKPCFDKTLAAYDLIRRMSAKKAGSLQVLIIANCLNAANLWANNFYKFISWRRDFCFVSDNDNIKNRPGVHTHEEYMRIQLNEKIMKETSHLSLIVTESLQELKESMYFGGIFDRLRWISETEFDLLIIDESQKGVNIEDIDSVFRKIKRKHTLHLSETMLKVLTDKHFNEEQIFTWSYIDEQRTKQNLKDGEFNVYKTFPELQMVTYQIPLMLERESLKDVAIAKGNSSTDCVFDLSELFRVKDPIAAIPEFKHKEEVKKFLYALATNKKYPFSTPELRDELSHTIWLLDCAASARALVQLLKAHPIFSEYKIMLVVADGKFDENKASGAAFYEVRKAMIDYPKTITLFVGRLAVEMAISAWTGIFILSNKESLSSYMQAAFCVQAPYETTVHHNDVSQRVRKECAYMFDFDPVRALTIYDEFANNICGGTVGSNDTVEKRKDSIQGLLNFFPVLGEDEQGNMVEIDAQSILSIPRHLKSIEVVRHDFVSDYLFDNINNIFAAPVSVMEIVKNLKPVKKGGFDTQADMMKNLSDYINDQGEIIVSDETVKRHVTDIFGDKVYENIGAAIEPAFKEMMENNDVVTIKKSVKEVAEVLKEVVGKVVIDKALEACDLKKSTRDQLVGESDSTINHFFIRAISDFEQQDVDAWARYYRKLYADENLEEIEEARNAYQKVLKEAIRTLKETVGRFKKEIIENEPTEVVRKLDMFKAEEEKANAENIIRDHLSSFLRMIPSFITAYGDKNLTLANFDDYIEDDIFTKVTGITKRQFRFLRDGGDCVDDETGNIRHFAGCLFDETVFNDSIREFLAKQHE